MFEIHTLLTLHSFPNVDLGLLKTSTAFQMSLSYDLIDLFQNNYRPD